MGIAAGWKTFKDPESQLRDLSHDDRVDLYSMAWAYYRNRQFSRRNGEDWSYYLAARDLYKHTRLIYNPVPSIVDFYVDNIWQSVKHDKFENLVTPLSSSTDEKIVEAVAQLDQWSNFLAEEQKIKRYAAAAGNVLVEGIDDLDRNKILHKANWPGYVTDLQLNATGDVLSYTLEYDVYDRDRKSTYRYKKIVDQEKYQYFKDDRPFTPPGKTAEVEPNIYGFCFAVWIRHTDDGADHALPACNNFDKVDNVNSLASHIDDFIHKDIESPKIIGASGEIVPLIGATQNKDTKLITPQDPRLNWVVLKVDTKAGAASVHDLSGILKLQDASPELKRQIDSFENDYPELQAASIVRENSQLSGAALERMLGPAQNRLDGVQAGYNQQLIKLRQMQVAVGGMRANGGGWRGLSSQQQAFRPFNLQSYSRGELNFNLKRSVLVQTTEMENEELLMKKAERADKLNGKVDDREVLKVAGYSEDKVDEILQRKAQEDALIVEDTVIPVGSPESRQLIA